MKKKFHILKTFLFLAFSFNSFHFFSQDITFSGNLSSQTGIALPYTNATKGELLKGQAVFDGSIKAYLENSMFYLNADVIYDGLGSLSSNGSEALVSENANFALKLNEAYIDYNGSWWALRAGRQIISWGKADGYQLTDILCPQNSSKIIACDYKEKMTGIDAIRLSYLGDLFQADAYWIPFFTPAALPMAKGNPLNKIFFPTDYNGIKITFPEKQEDFIYPEKNITSSELGLRVSAYFSALDFSLYAFYGWDDLPFSSYNGEFDEIGDLTGINIVNKYERFFMIGADTAIPAGDFVFRLESAFFPMRFQQTNPQYQLNLQTLNQKSEAAKQYNQIIALAGFDWDAGNGWTLTAQYIADAVFADSESIKELERNIFQHEATLSIEKTLLNDTLTISLEGALDLNEFSSASELSLSYSLSDSINLSLIGDFFCPGINGQTGIYGDYFDLSAITLKTKISF